MITKIYEKIKEIILANFKILILYICLIALFFIKIPYVIYAPGGAINLNERILVGNNNKTNGSLSMAYVKQIEANIPFALLSFVIPNWDLIKTEDITYDNETLKQLNKINKLQLEEAIDNATISAFTIANKDYEIEDNNLNIIYISEEAKTNLELFDQITKINGKNINSLEEMQNEILQLKANENVNIEVKRKNKNLELTAKTYKDNDGNTRIGISTINDYDIKTDPSVEIQTKASESGPSGGLMMALSIYNNLSNIDLTQGRDIIGTGTIDINGKVGEIGGVKYKILGAAKKNADIFLCPEENYKEALKTVEDNNLNLKVYAVKTLQEAISYLENND